MSIFDKLDKIEVNHSDKVNQATKDFINYEINKYNIELSLCNNLLSTLTALPVINFDSDIVRNDDSRDHHSFISSIEEKYKNIKKDFECITARKSHLIYNIVQKLNSLYNLKLWANDYSNFFDNDNKTSCEKILELLLHDIEDVNTVTFKNVKKDLHSSLSTYHKWDKVEDTKLDKFKVEVKKDKLILHDFVNTYKDYNKLVLLHYDTPSKFKAISDAIDIFYNKKTGWVLKLHYALVKRFTRNTFDYETDELKINMFKNGRVDIQFKDDAEYVKEFYNMFELFGRFER